MAKFVVSDSSPLIGLATAGVFDSLQQLFDRVTVTRIVVDEIMAGRGMPGAAELSGAMRQGWIRVAPAPPETWSFAELGAGEASTIALALSLARQRERERERERERQRSDEATVLMDDALGRAQAVALGLEVVDVASLLLAFKHRGLVEAVRPVFERLARRGFIVPETSIQTVLAAAGEAEPTPP